MLLIVTPLVVATQNPGKFSELQATLAGLSWELLLMPEGLEIAETGDTFLANACLKASKVAEATGHWAIADDSGLVVDALDGAPGIYSARYGQTDLERIQRLLNELGDEPQRAAHFVCVMALADSTGRIVAQAEGVCSGEILRAPRGKGGFGYDPIFYLPEREQTFAELTPEEKHQISHRGRAVQALLPKLRALP
nr:RdgB/HAM1 family non-canonical purine NTP pyrophosphatase [Petrachloros mirabilis]